jgi:hypothetical protein
MKTNMKHVKYLFLLAVIAFFPSVSEGSAITVRPFLIDEVVEARQLLREEVTLVNQSNREVNVYATVNEISVDNDGEIKEFVSPVMTDRTNTITSWVELNRGRIEIAAGETVQIPLAFRVHPNAQPGEYHVFVGFGIASKRYQVEAAARNGDLDGVIVKLTIEDDRNEYLRVASFIVDRFVTSDADKRVEIELENLGDVPATPAGEIIFFNSNGEERQAIPVNTDALSIEPGETVTITTALPFNNELGRFKANLSLRYGTGQKASLFDTTQFFMMPFHILILMLVMAVLLALFVYFLLHQAFINKNDDEDGFDLPFMVRDGHDAEPQEHDIDLKTKQ